MAAVSPYTLVRPCWHCLGAVHATPTACDTCAGHGRLRITYGVDEAGELTQTVEPQPDSPLPSTPHLNARQREQRARRTTTHGS